MLTFTPFYTQQLKVDDKKKKEKTQKNKQLYTLNSLQALF